MSGDRVVDIHFTETITNASTEDVKEETGLANATTEMESSEPSCSTRDVEEETGLANSTTEMESSAEPSCSSSFATSDAENQAERSLPKPSKDANKQTEEFVYMSYKPPYQAPDREYFRSDDKVPFYTGLPSHKVLLATLNHVAPHVSRHTQTLDPFQEFIMVLINLQDLAYRFLVSKAPKSCWQTFILLLDITRCQRLHS